MSVELNCGLKMPNIAFGFWQSPAAECAQALEAAIDAGYRCLDGASVYGNEADIGEALAKVLQSGKVKREELFIVSKLWADDWHQVEAACDKTLKDMQLDYLDLYLVHMPVGIDKPAGLDSLGRQQRSKVPTHVMWKEMEGLVKKGKTKAIGVSNWSYLLLADCLNYCEIPPAVNQLEIHPTYNNEQVAQWCLTEGIVVMGYSTLGAGKPDMSLPAVEEAAKRLNVTPAQILMKWSLQKGYVPLTKSVNKERIVQNLQLDFELSKEEMEALNNVDGGVPMKVCDHSKQFGLPLYW